MKPPPAYLDVPAEDCLPVEQIASAESLKLQPMSLTTLVELQKSCPEIKRIKSGDIPKNTTFKEVEMDQMLVICETSSNQPRPFVPEPLRDQLVLALHSIDHIGQKPTAKRVAEDYYWPTLKKDAKLYVKRCLCIFH